MATVQYRPGNRFSDRVNIADAAVDWQGLSPQERELVVVEDGLPSLAGTPELRERAEALLSAAWRGKIEGLTHNEDGYDLPAERILLQRESVTTYINSVDKQITINELRSSAAAAEDLDKLLRVEDVIQVLGFSRTTFYRRLAEGLIEPAHLDSPPRWRTSYIQSLLEGK